MVAQGDLLGASPSAAAAAELLSLILGPGESDLAALLLSVACFIHGAFGASSFSSVDDADAGSSVLLSRLNVRTGDTDRDALALAVPAQGASFFSGDFAAGWSSGGPAFVTGPDAFFSLTCHCWPPDCGGDFVAIAVVVAVDSSFGVSEGLTTFLSFGGADAVVAIDSSFGVSEGLTTFLSLSGDFGAVSVAGPCFGVSAGLATCLSLGFHGAAGFSLSSSFSVPGTSGMPSVLGFGAILSFGFQGDSPSFVVVALSAVALSEVAAGAFVVFLSLDFHAG